MSTLQIRPAEKKELDFMDFAEDCDHSHFGDEFGNLICEVNENDGGNCYPKKCPLCELTTRRNEVVQVLREVVK